MDPQRASFEFLQQSQYWPSERMANHQRAALERLLRHAAASTPLYNGRLGSVLSRPGSVDWDRWTEIPILKRTDLLAEPQASLASQPISGDGEVGSIRTSGTTGKPLEVFFTQASAIATVAAKWRGDNWAHVDCDLSPENWTVQNWSFPR